MSSGILIILLRFQTELLNFPAVLFSHNFCVRQRLNHSVAVSAGRILCLGEQPPSELSKLWRTEIIEKGKRKGREIRDSG